MALSDPARTEKLTAPLRRAWWKESTVYQIYPASFKDSTGNGKGDIRGIISKLDYIKSLGVDIVWLSPILKSPQVDMGYDISDYRDIDALYGTMADHDALIQGLHDRGLKYVMDLVVNHTSEEHEWFKQSRSSKDNPYRNWYFWRPPKYDAQGNRMPPNNWEAAFSGSVWEWDETTQEYYLHLFAKEQPDLNWDCPDVVKAVHELIRFWLDRGVDGFRMDVINFISKDPALPDGEIKKPGFLQSGVAHFACGPRLHEYFQGIGKILKEYDAFSVGEMPGVYDTKEILKAVGQDRGELAMAFQFEIAARGDTNAYVLVSCNMDRKPASKWLHRDFHPLELKQVVNKWQTFMLENGGWNALYMENHDQARTVSRYCSDDPRYRSICSKLLASHFACQSGTLFVYQGQELAMANQPREWGMEMRKDIECLNHWKTVLEQYPNDLKKQKEFLDQYWLIGRDNARTPMQWTPTDNDEAGFMPAIDEIPGDGKKTKPWMSIHPDFKDWNAEKLIADANSSFHYWQRLLRLRKELKDVIVYGDFLMLDLPHESVIAYIRTAGPQPKTQGDEGRKSKLLSIANFSSDEKGLWWEVPDQAAEILLNGPGDKLNESAIISELRNYSDPNEVKTDENGKQFIKLRAYEAIVALA